MTLNTNDNIDWMQAWKQIKSNSAYIIGIVTIFWSAFLYYHEQHQKIETLQHQIYADQSRYEIADNDRKWLRIELERCLQHLQQHHLEKEKKAKHEIQTLASDPRGRR